MAVEQPVLRILIYLGAHFLLYAVWLRRVQLFARENVIFLYHFLSWVAAAAVLGGSQPALFVFYGSLHGIYSLSFLALWSSSDGGYSLRILNHIDRALASGEKIRWRDLENLGTLKKEDRTGSLEKLGLVRCSGGSCRQTLFGLWVTRAIQTLCWLCCIRGAS